MVRTGLLGFLLLLACQASWAASVTTTLERPEIRSGESFSVTFRVDGAVDEPDFSPLTADFEIVSRSRRQSLAADGQADATTIWTLVLVPRRMGMLTLPRIRFGNASSDPLEVSVRGSPGREDMYVEYSVDDPTPYVNQQVLVTTQVYTAVDVRDLDVSTPRIAQGRGSLQPLGGARSYQSVSGGRRYAVREQRYTLVPSTTGPLSLAPLNATATRTSGETLQARSGSLSIEVVAPRAREPEQAAGPGPEDLFLETEVDKPGPYVQEQVLYTVRLFRSVPIENAHLSAPAVRGGDAVIERVDLSGFRNDRSYQTTRRDRQYAVIERRFAVFPQSAGTLTLEPLTLTAAVPVAAAGGTATDFWKRSLTTPVRIQSDAIELAVKPPPEGAPRPWLPASSMTLDEDWPARDSVQIGTPVSRRVVLKAEGLLGSQLPELAIPLPAAMKSYPEQPRRETTTRGGIKGRLEQIMAVIPSRTGSFTLPAYELAWWNTRTDSKEVLRLPAHSLEVTANPAIAPPAGAAGDGDGTDGPGPAPVPRAAWWLSLGLGLAWLITLFLWRRERRRAAESGGQPGEKPVASRRRAERRLRAACDAGDAPAARDALLEWAQARWPERPPRSLGALCTMVDEAAAGEIAGLQQALYAARGGAWRGESLYRALSAFEPERAATPGSVGGLKPLYEH